MTTTNKTDTAAFDSAINDMVEQLMAAMKAEARGKCGRKASLAVMKKQEKKWQKAAK